MSELEPGHPDELVRVLNNWLREALSPIGYLPEGTDPVEWAVRRFIASWQGPVRARIDVIEERRRSALESCRAGSFEKAIQELELASEDVWELRDKLGLYDAAGRRTFGLQDQISWYVELAVKPGQLDNFRALSGEMVRVTRRESGVLAYQRFASSDSKLIHVYERYANSDAANAHLQIFMNMFADRFQQMVERTRFLVFGCPTAELKATLERFGATYLGPFGDFEYWA
jgi:quinol monooxygenase YgiN